MNDDSCAVRPFCSIQLPLSSDNLPGNDGCIKVSHVFDLIWDLTLNFSFSRSARSWWFLRWSWRILPLWLFDRAGLLLSEHGSQGEGGHPADLLVLCWPNCSFAGVALAACSVLRPHSTSLRWNHLPRVSWCRLCGRTSTNKSMNSKFITFHNEVVGVKLIISYLISYIY